MNELINKNLFLASIKEISVSTKDLANLLGISIVTLYRKINSKSEFTHSEINKLRTILSEDKIQKIFFN